MIHSTPHGIALTIRVVPRAGFSGVAGTRGDALLVRLRAAPADGAANLELIEVIATALRVPRRAVTIISGARSRLKRIAVTGIDDATAQARLCQPRDA